MSAGDWKDMYLACQTGDLELVRYHLDRGVDPNYQHPEILATPLVTAILADRTDVALLLLKSNADPKLRSFMDDLTPLEAAVRRNDAVVLAELRRRGVFPYRPWFLRLFRRE